MNAADLRDYVGFEEGEVLRHTVFESDRLWAQLLCIDRNRSFGPVSDPETDALLTILAGEAVFVVNKRRRRMKQWGAVVVPAGDEVAVSNASVEPLVVLMVTAPPPTPHAVSG